MKIEKKLKILCINRWIGYNEGGNETHTKELLVWLAKMGHEVSVITTNGSALEDFSYLKIHYVKSPKKYFSYGTLGIFYALLFDLKCFIKFCLLYLKGERYDLISVHFSLEAVLARFIKLFFGVPYVMRLAGDTPLELIEGKRADASIHVSNFMNEQSKKYGYSAEVIPKGFDLDRFNPKISTSYLKIKHQVRDNDSILLTVCRLDPRKNLITLIEAMNILVNLRGRKTLKLFIVGDGVERKFLESKTKMYKLNENITFLGSIKNTDPLLAQYYVLANLFVLPTLYEGFGWVFLESMACGTPVLTTTAGSNPEVVGEDGALIKPQDPELLANGIEKLIDTPRLLEEFSRRGLAKAKSLPWEKQIKKYQEVYIKASKKSCRKIFCRLKVILYLFFDSFLIFKYLFSGVILNKTSKTVSTWKKSGQVGNIS